MKLKMVTSNGSRYYQTPKGNLVPSVTTVLGSIAKPALVGWAAKMEREAAVEVIRKIAQNIKLDSDPDLAEELFLDLMGKQKAHSREMSKAGEIGSQAHERIEWELKRRMGRPVGNAPQISDAAEWAYMAWEDWAKQVELVPIAIEETVWSERYGYAGTADLIAWIEGQRTLLDWKTGKSVYREAWLQNAAYRYAWNEMHEFGDTPEDLPVVRGIVVRLPKVIGDPATEAVEITDADNWFRAFMHAKELWHAVFEGEK